jgi:HTH DNA binding domain
MLIAKLEILLPCPWLQGKLLPNCFHARSISWRPCLDSEGFQVLVEFEHSDGSHETVHDLTEFQTCPGCYVGSLRNGHAVMYMKENACPCIAAGLTSLYTLSQGSNENGTMIWEILIPNRRILKETVRKIKSSGLVADVIAVRRLSTNHVLTRKQREILEIAYRKGFFDVPRKINLKELAKELGVSGSTLMESLRRAQGRVLQERFSFSQPLHYVRETRKPVDYPRQPLLSK